MLDYSADMPIFFPMHSTTAFQVAKLPPQEAVDAIRFGLPANAFDGVADIFDLSTDRLAATLGLSVRTIRDQRKRRVRLSRETTEKLVRAARVHELGRKIFSTDNAVSQWLVSPAPALNGQPPITMLDTDLGAREVESILLGMAYGNVM
jgi:putative toxin-antitoxin system antitoxin component (TIGR02293 family)